MGPKPSGGGWADFLRLCRGVGRKLRLVQACGGNVSVKTGDGRMLIKSTGARLRDIGRASGWSWADLGKLRAGLSPAGGNRDDGAYAALLKDAAAPGNRPCSLESGSHAALEGRCVVHVHSLAGILTGMLPSEAGERLARAALPAGTAVRFIPPCPPGLELSRRVGAARVKGGGPAFYFLRNHGLLLEGPKPGPILRDLARFETAAGKRFGLAAMTPPHRLRDGVDGARRWCFCGWRRFSFEPRPFFPDFAVYYGAGRTFPRVAGPVVRAEGKVPGDGADERGLLFAHAVISTAASGLGRPAYLAEAEVAAVLRLKTESARLALIRSAEAGP